MQKSCRRAGLQDLHIKQSRELHRMVQKKKPEINSSVGGNVYERGQMKICRFFQAAMKNIVTQNNKSF